MSTNKITTITAEEGALAEEANIRQQIADLRTDLRESQRSRRQVALELSSGTAENTAEAVTEARELLADRQAEVEQAQSDLALLEQRLDRGDDSVSTEDLTIANTAIDRAQRLIPAAKKQLRAAERAHDAAQADQHLAFLAADVIEEVSDVPVIVRKDRKQVPEVDEALVLSQNNPTADFGTLSANGHVDVFLIGNPSINWKSINEEFARLGGEVSASPAGIAFDEALWPVPLLHRPVKGWLHKAGNRLCDLFTESIEVVQTPNGPISTVTGAQAFADVVNTSLDDDNGEVSATVEVVLAATGFPKDRDAMERAVKPLLRNLPTGDTPVGRVTGYDLAEVHSEPHYEFSTDAGVILGGPPMPWRVVINLHAHYQPTEEV